MRDQTKHRKLLKSWVCPLRDQSAQIPHNVRNEAGRTHIDKVKGDMGRKAQPGRGYIDKINSKKAKTENRKKYVLILI